MGLVEMSDAGRRGNPRVTSFDVAERAGVSQSTVSRALSGSPSITSGTRERVLAAASELGYQVDHRASQLRTGKTATVAVVVLRRPDDTVHTSNPFYFELLGCICEAAASRDLDTLVSLQSEDGDLFGDYVGRGQADGTIVIGSATNSDAWAYFRELQDDDNNVVFWGSPFDDGRRVRSDNYAGGRLATRHLLDRGYRRIGFVGPIGTRHTQFVERYKGYCDELEKEGLKPVALPDYPDDDRVGQGRHAARELRQKEPEIQAFFAASDQLAFGVLQELQEAGVSIPDQIGVVGFDGMASGALCSPPLTTIAPDLREAAKLLLQGAIDRVEHPDERAPVKLVVRSSS